MILIDISIFFEMGYQLTVSSMFIDIDEWNYLDDSSDDGWVEENDDFTAELEKKEKERIDSLQDLIEENDSPKKGNQ